MILKLIGQVTNTKNGTKIKKKTKLNAANHPLREGFKEEEKTIESLTTVKPRGWEQRDGVGHSP